MKRITAFFIFCIVTALLVCGCTSNAPVQPVTPGVTKAPASPVPAVSPTLVAPPLFYGDWVLTTMAIQNGTVPQQPSGEITLKFNSDGSLAGYGGCNNYFGSYVLNGATSMYGNGITVGPLASSKKYCEITSGQETTYLRILEGTTAYTINMNKITLTDASENVLVFQTPASLPAQGK